MSVYEGDDAAQPLQLPHIPGGGACIQVQVVKKQDPDLVELREEPQLVGAGRLLPELPDRVQMGEDLPLPGHLPGEGGGGEKRVFCHGLDELGLQKTGLVAVQKGRVDGDGQIGAVMVVRVAACVQHVGVAEDAVTLFQVIGAVIDLVQDFACKD